MALRMKNRIIQSFNKGALTYDSSAALQRKAAERLAQRLKNFTAERILEIGCGTGLYSQTLITSFPQAAFLLTDISPAMVEVCKSRFKNLPRVEISCQDGEAFSKPHEFDLITSNMTFQWFTDFRSSLEKILTMLVPGGRCIFTVLGSNSLIEWRDICEKFSISMPSPEFPEFVKIKNYFPQIKFDNEEILQPYKGIKEFIKTLKKIGASATRDNYIPSSVGKMRQIISKFTSDIYITYEIIYGEFIKC